MKAQKVLNLSEINNILKHSFKTKRIVNSGNCIGYIVNLQRCMLPVSSVATEVSGADVLAMLAKLNEWEQTIEEVRQGLLKLIEEQAPSSP
ncbi:hypothetical protein [Pseudomonas sp. P8_250]|uniref:hypothetical protein n=1 Tax=Pseudomonas sp. P8_250 TaxID=3043446 RepID=UPI002A36D312|nr:hypothetical protein [Pseudomonas sp. P8_250]MDX9668729.1 hypothetical protein [Pseudomonas sp. P8_250]